MAKHRSQFQPFLSDYRQTSQQETLSNPQILAKMEGDEIFASIDSLWFYSSVFLQPSSKQKSDNSSGELRPRKQKDSTENHEMNGGGGPGGSQDHRRIKEAAPVAAKRRAAARSRELDERMETWQKQSWQMRTAAPVRCSPSRMPPPSDGLAMKAHLRSWAHAVACSVR